MRGVVERPLLEVCNVSVGFDDGDVHRLVFDALSFDVMPAQTVALWGPSGSGKTSLLNLVGGLLAADAGDVLYHLGDVNYRLSELDDAGRRQLRRVHIGYVFQFFNLVPTLSVAENVRLPLELAGRPDLTDRALARLDVLGLGDKSRRFPDALSGGEQQRVAIARALAHAPAIVLADEPTGNLDARNSANVVDLLWQECRGSGAALIVATHSTPVADRCDRVIEL